MASACKEQDTEQLKGLSLALSSITGWWSWWLRRRLRLLLLLSL
jgi:hypothetical protein